MDPVLRTVSDVRALKGSVANPFDKDALADYFCSLGEEMGFQTFKNFRKGIARALCAWKDGGAVFLAANAEYGSVREILGAVAELIIINPEVGVLITASNPLKRITDVFDGILALRPRFDIVVLDVNTGNVLTHRGK